MFIYSLFQRILLSLLQVVTLLVKNEKFVRFVKIRSVSNFMKCVEQIDLASLSNSTPPQQILWVHVSSAGELEQAIPVARALGDRFGLRFFVTYYSPSAEPFLKNFPYLISAVGLPIDCQDVFLQALQKLQVCGVMFVRYDFWPGLVRSCNIMQVPLFLLSATRNTTGKRAVKITLSNLLKATVLKHFQTIFAVENADVSFFEKLVPGVEIVHAGDGKWARAKERAQELQRLGVENRLGDFASFCHAQRSSLNRTCMVFGSPHREEREIAFQCLESLRSVLIIYVPHSVSPSAIAELRAEAEVRKVKVTLLSDLEQRLGSLSAQESIDTRCVIVDRIGVLAEVYALGDVAVVGGGFDGQVHNVLEPAAHPVSVLVGSRTTRAAEVQLLLQKGAAICFPSPQKLFEFLRECATVDPDGVDSRRAFDAKRALADVRKRACELFGSIPDTSEVVSIRIKKYL